MTPLRARLMSPPNAVPDTGIHLVNGSPAMRVIPYRPSRWKTPHITQIAAFDPIPLPPETDRKLPPGFIKPRATCREVIAQACVVWGIGLYDMLSNRRTADIVTPRQAAMAISRRLTPLSFPRIGKEFRRDHATVVHGCRQMDPHIAALNQELDDWSTPAEWVRALKARLEA